MHVQSCWFSQRTYCFLFSFPWNRCRGWVNSLIWGLSKHDVHSTENGLGKNALFRLAHFVKCWRFFLPLNSWGLFPGSEKERKIRRHTFTFFVKRCRIHVIVRKSVMHVHGCCFAPKTFYYYYFFLRCRCFLRGIRVNSLILTWMGGVRWFRHWRGSRVHDFQSLLFLLNHWLPREVGGGVDWPCHSSSSLSLCFPIRPSLQCFLFPFLLLSLYSLLMPLPSFLLRWFHLRMHMYQFFFIVFSNLPIPLCSFVFRCLTQ